MFKVQAGARGTPKFTDAEIIAAMATRAQQAAAKSGRAADRHGKDSPKHKAAMVRFRNAADLYEAGCRATGVEAYATYAGD